MSIFSKVLPCIAGFFLMSESATAEERPNFDCARATTSVEGVICAVPELARLDREVARAYEQLRDGLGDAGRARLSREQQEWLSARDACGPVPDCLSREIEARIAALGGSPANAPASADTPPDKGAIRAVQGVISALGDASTPFMPDGISGSNTRAGAARVTAALGLASGTDDMTTIYDWLTAATQTPGHFRGWADCGERLGAEAFLFDVAAPDWNANAFFWIGEHGFRAKAYLRAGGRVEVTATDVWPDTGPRDTTFRAWGRREDGGESIILDRVSGGVARQRCREIVLTRVLPVPDSPQESAPEETLVISQQTQSTPPEPLVEASSNQRMANSQWQRATASVDRGNIFDTGFRARFLNDVSDTGTFEPLFSRNGVSVRSRRSKFLISFASSGQVLEYDAQSLIPSRFCQTVGLGLSSVAAKGMDDATRIISSNSDILSGNSFPRAAVIEMVRDENFVPIVGVSFGELSTDTQANLFERLRICAIFGRQNVRNNLSETIVEGVNLESVHGMLNLVSLAKSGGGRPIPFISSAGLAARMFRGFEDQERRLATELSRANKADATELRSIFTRYSQNLPAEIIEGYVAPAQQLAQNIRLEAEAQERAAVAALEASLPARNQSELIELALAEYFEENCKFELISQIGRAQGQTPLMLSAAGYEGKQGRCELNFYTHLLTLGVGLISADKCSSGDTQQCHFQLNLSCTYRINPDFGFDNSTRDFDPGICTAISSGSYNIEAEFKVKTHRSWHAKSVRF